MEEVSSRFDLEEYLHMRGKAGMACFASFVQIADDKLQLAISPPAIWRKKNLYWRPLSGLHELAGLGQAMQMGVVFFEEPLAEIVSLLENDFCDTAWKSM
ncbi:hypothetical protein ACOSQ3_023778 [Xanthoceras sorbifolium]